MNLTRLWQDKHVEELRRRLAKISTTLDEYRETINAHYVMIKKENSQRKEELKQLMQDRQEHLDSATEADSRTDRLVPLLVGVVLVYAIHAWCLWLESLTSQRFCCVLLS